MTTNTPFPDAHYFTPGNGEPSFRWGIVGTGWIAGAFIEAVRRHTRQRICAVASRSPDRAEAFSERFGLERAFSPVEWMLESPEIDAVYIATPASDHGATATKAVAAGKHVLVEKPFATSSAEASTLADLAQRTGILLMEGMWTRYLPQSAVIRALLEGGVFGELRTVHADHGQATPVHTGARHYRPELGGGALFELGIYPVQFDSMVMGSPTSITATGTLTSTSVDASATVVLAHGEAKQSVVTTSMLTQTSSTAMIAGTKARLDIHGSFYIPTSMTLTPAGHFRPSSTWTDPTGVMMLEGLSDKRCVGLGGFQ